MKRSIRACILAAAVLAACDQPTQNRYDAKDVGMNAVVQFGTILSERQVQVTGQNNGNGALIGAAGGGVGGSLIGAGRGSIVGALAGALAGGLVGNTVEQKTGDRTGIEYVIALENGVNQSIVQNIGKDDQSLRVGQRVMVQTSGSYRRVLPADNITPAAPVPAGR